LFFKVHGSIFKLRCISMNEDELIWSKGGSLIQNFNTRKLANFLNKNLKFHSQIQIVTLKIISCRTTCKSLFKKVKIWNSMVAIRKFSYFNLWAPPKLWFKAMTPYCIWSLEKCKKTYFGFHFMKVFNDTLSTFGFRT